MGINYLKIEFDRDVYQPGQIVSGRVLLALDRPKDLQGIELKLSGKAKCSWTTSESYRDSEGNTRCRDVSHIGKETYITSKINLASRGGKFELPIGQYEYPFSVLLPSSTPPSFYGTYGGITYYGKAKLDIPWAPDKSEKKFFTVQNVVNLNNTPELNNPYQGEKSKTFCCWCCASRPLTLTLYIPRIGYTFNEEIPITVEVDNASNVKVKKVEAKLNQRLTWRALDDTKDENIKIKELSFGEVNSGDSKTWNEAFDLKGATYPNTGNCGIIKLKYELEMVLDPEGMHHDLEIKTPITIGHVAFGAEVTLQILGQPIQPGFIPPTSNPGFNQFPSEGVGVPPQGYPTPGYPGVQPNPVAPNPSLVPGPVQGSMTSYPGFIGALNQFPSAPYSATQPVKAPEFGQAAQLIYPAPNTPLSPMPTPSAPSE